MPDTSDQSLKSTRSASAVQSLTTHDESTCSSSTAHNQDQPGNPKFDERGQTNDENNKHDIDISCAWRVDHDLRYLSTSGHKLFTMNRHPSKRHGNAAHATNGRLQKMVLSCCVPRTGGPLSMSEFQGGGSRSEQRAMRCLLLAEEVVQTLGVSGSCALKSGALVDHLRRHQS